MNALFLDKLLALFDRLSLVSDHYRKEYVLRRLNHTPMLLWLRIRGMGKEDCFEGRTHTMPRGALGNLAPLEFAAAEKAARPARLTLQLVQ